MKLQNQVCALEQSRRLKELGVCQVAQYIWRDGKLEHVDGINSWSDQETVKEMLKKYDAIWEKRWRDDWQIYSAFTVAELGVMLPATIDGLKLTQWPISFKEAATTYGMQYRWDAHDAHHRVYPLHVVFGDSEAQARADLLICLIADGKVSAEEVNQRLQNS